MSAALGTVQKFKTRSVATKAIQFTGENGKAVAEFALEHGTPARNGGRYVSITLPNGAKATVRKGDFVSFIEEDGSIGVFTAEEFEITHVITKNHQVL